jgi:hypothetical protein
MTRHDLRVDSTHTSPSDSSSTVLSTLTNSNFKPNGNRYDMKSQTSASSTGHQKQMIGSSLQNNSHFKQEINE